MKAQFPQFLGTFVYKRDNRVDTKVSNLLDRFGIQSQGACLLDGKTQVKTTPRSMQVEMLIDLLVARLLKKENGAFSYQGPSRLAKFLSSRSRQS